jgi:hypothetical protein
VAAAPVRDVTEPAPGGETPSIRRGWRAAPPGTSIDVNAESLVKEQLATAASTVGHHVSLVDVLEGMERADLALDALIVEGAPGSRDPKLGGGPLVVALAPEGSAGDHVRTLAHDADLVVSPSVHGRFLLATILALLRWRSR